MDIDTEDIGEDETDWNSTPTPAPAGSQAKVYSKQPSPQRVILHFDLDCFYAQVEMIRNPALRNVPLGIQQKYIVVTCNYVARDLGVTKLMSVTSALEKCPQLVLVKGEDLTYYRETSYKVTELLMSYCPSVERLGFDENFMDITELVERRLRQEGESSNYSFNGHTYNHDGLDANARDHSRLAIGSHIAAELREAIHKKLGLTGCAGIATNKLLAKLVSGTFKPNQQTTLLQESIKDMMSSLSGLRKVPGVGHQTAKKLQALGLVSVRDLQLFPLADLEQEFGSSTAQRLRNLSLGIDDSPVTPTGAPQSLSDEDSFKKMSSAKEVFQKIQDLLSSLLERMYKDGRQPLTFRLTIRKYTATNKWFSRESRQCPIPNHIGQKITSGSSDGLAQLISMGMKLFNKMVDTTAAFHLTLINVCFSNLQARGAANSKGSIASFFTHKSPDKTQTSPQCQDGLFQCRSSTSMEQGGSNTEGSRPEGTFDQDASQWIPATPPDLGDQPHWQSAGRLSPLTSPLTTPQPRSVTSHICGTVSNQRTDTPESKHSVRLPLNVDPEVFSLLPEDIQRELLSPANPDRSQKPLIHSTLAATVSCGERIQSAPCTFTDKVFSDLEPPRTQTNDNFMALPDPQASQVNCSAEEGTSIDQLSACQSTDSDLPKDIDPEVFSELPPEVQRELRSEWKQQKPILKITPTSKKQGKSSLAKERKAAAKGSQRNNLLKYFKPS